MGVPALFRWLSQKYPKIVSSVIEEQPQEIDGVEVPIDISGPNPNGEEMDNLYLDMNGIVHPCSHPEDRPPPETEDEMMLAVFEYTDRVINMVRPRKLLMIAIDGVAPRAKMNQQRSRRFRSAKEAKEKEEEAAEFVKMLAAGGTKVDDSIKNRKVWDSNAITPGTPFMDTLAISLRYWIAYKLNNDPAWAKLKIIISDSTVPGEGEHKIMNFVRSQRASPEHDPNTRHVIYGLDADLIMLGLGTHEPHFRVLREDVFFDEKKGRMCKVCGQTGHKAEECTGKAKEKEGEFDEKSKGKHKKPFIWLHVEILREYLSAELDVPGLPFKFDLERALDDWVFMCFFVGNDFLPHLPSLDIRDGGIDTLISIWREKLPIMGGYLTKDGSVDLPRAQHILDALAKLEDDIFQRRKQMEDRREAGAKRRRMEQQNREYEKSMEVSYANGAPAPPPSVSVQGATANAKKGKQPVQPNPMMPLFKPGDRSAETKALNHDMIVNRGAIRQANLANKSAALALKETILKKATGEEDKSAVPAKRKADEVEESPTPAPLTPSGESDNEPNLDTVRLWSPGYRDRYYEQKFGAAPDDLEIRKAVASAYAEGLCWVLLYYFQGCPSWTWYYPYHYAPFAADFADVLSTLKVNFDKGKPFKPYEQLMGVLPAASKHNLPEKLQLLMTQDDSEIIDFYPEDFPIDLNGKKFAWQGVALLPFIDEKRLLDAVNKVYPKLTEAELSRNAMGEEVLFVSDKHPLYDDLAMQFYSRKAAVDEYELKPSISEGLVGTVKKSEDFVPHGTFHYPLKSGNMPDLEDDRSMCLTYEMPKTRKVHKSMLLRGVVLNKPAVTQAELQIVKSKAASGGRTYGGAQYGRGGGSFNRGRGGRFNNNNNNRNDNYRPNDNYGSNDNRNDNRYGNNNRYDNNNNNGNRYNNGGHYGRPPPPPPPPGQWNNWGAQGGQFPPYPPPPPPPGQGYNNLQYPAPPPFPPPQQWNQRFGQGYPPPPPPPGSNRGGYNQGYNGRR